jgi:hypothetical protein
MDHQGVHAYTAHHKDQPKTACEEDPPKENPACTMDNDRTMGHQSKMHGSSILEAMQNGHGLQHQRWDL